MERFVHVKSNKIEVLRMVQPPLAAALVRLGTPPAEVERADDLLQRHARPGQRETEVAGLVTGGSSDKLIANACR
jgi:hypothetical protein